jgi:acyl-CoA synthetase (AMP-forming)/AMP-acid ligase II/acyl carrier protein
MWGNADARADRQDLGRSDPASGSSTLLDLLRWRSAHQPDRRAYTFLRDGEQDEAHITYQELDRRARAIGASLQQVARAGDRALLLYPSGLDYIAAFLGCLYAPVTAVPAYRPNPRLERTVMRLRAIARDARPTVVLTTESMVGAASQLAALDPSLAGTTWLATDTIADGAAGTWREPAIDRNTLAFLQYTSGSTTTPRGVMVSHGNLMHNEALIKRTIGSTEDSVGVSWLPLFHDMGMIGFVVQPLYTGFPAVLMSPAHFGQKPVRWLRAITRYRGTVSAGPNSAYDLCVRKTTPEERAGLDLSSWRVAVNGAEPVRPETIQRFLANFAQCGLRPDVLVPSYGLAEATLLVSGGPVARRPVVAHAAKAALLHGQVEIVPGPQATVSTALAGSGQVLHGQHVLIVDPETRRRCRPDRVGEIWVAGPSVAKGYWNSPEATAATFQARLADIDEGAFLRTGDLGFIHDGGLFVTGRIKDLIIVHGGNHAPQDIERTAEGSHPALPPGCGTAFSVDDDVEPQLVVVHEVGRAHLDVDCEEVAAAIRRAVAVEHELVVHTVVLLKTGTLPRTTSGKLQRRGCRDEFLRGTLPEVGRSVRPVPGRTAPSDDEATGSVLVDLLDAETAQRLPLLVSYLQHQIAGAVSVPYGNVDVDLPFLALGLDSLRLLELKQRTETELGVAVPLEHFFEYPTIRELAAPVLVSFERNVDAVRTELDTLADDEIDARLAQLATMEA